MSMLHIGSNDNDSKLSGIQDGDSQPNAVDLRVKKIFRIHDKVMILDEDRKIHRGSHELPLQDDGYWFLQPGCYEIIMENEIEVAHGEAGFVITRSTLNRNGVFITSGLYDSGYSGKMAGCMHIQGGPLKLKPGTRVAQYLSWKAQTHALYAGDYGHGKDHDKKYE